MNKPTFIPILSIPGLMGSSDISKFYKEYWLYGGNNKSPKSILHHVKNTRLLVNIILKPENKIVQAKEEKNNSIPSIIMKALVDTGAKTSAIRKGKAKKLKITSFKGNDFNGFGQKTHKQGRNINVSINIEDVMPEGAYLDICPIVGSWDINESFDFIIGWDILKYCTLNYDGLNSTFTLEFIGKK